MIVTQRHINKVIETKAVPLYDNDGKYICDAHHLAQTLMRMSKMMDQFGKDITKACEKLEAVPDDV